MNSCCEFLISGASAKLSSQLWRWGIVQALCPWALSSWWCLCEHLWMLHGAPQDWPLWGPLHKCCWRLSKDRVMAARTAILKKHSQIFSAVHLWMLSPLFNHEVQSSFGWSHTGLKPWGCLIKPLSFLYRKCDSLKTHTVEIQWSFISFLELPMNPQSDQPKFTMVNKAQWSSAVV